MKRQNASVTAVIALSSLMAFGPMARGQDKNDAKPAPKPEPKPEVRPLPQPGPRPDRLQRLREFLKLSDDQFGKFQPIMEVELKETADLRQVKDLSPQDRMAKLKAIRETTNEKVKPILTGEQLPRWEKMRGVSARPGAQPQPPLQPQPPAQPQPKPPEAK